VQVNPRYGITFATGLRALVRQDPDVIMVGEIRDRETAQIAIEAALTGHLVLSTLHTNDSTGAVARLIEMGIEPFLMTSSLLGVVAQRLVRCLCPACKKPRSLTAAERKWLLDLGGEELAAADTCYEPVGCPQCSQTGFQGRAAIQEILVPDEAFWANTLGGMPASRIREEVIEAGMEPMVLDGCRKALEGITSLDEVVRVTRVEGYNA
jgi:type II secretory ATPase GspE/PulE/Tfp pilus assembly ATPase PilB-like protein